MTWPRRARLLVTLMLTACSQALPSFVSDAEQPVIVRPPPPASLTPPDVSGAAPPRRRAAQIIPARTASAPGLSAHSRSAAAPIADGADITFNFSNVDVREVLREVLGDQLNLPYVVDPQVQASVTAQTGGPVPRNEVLPTLENILRANGVALMQTNGVYRAMPLADAAKAAVATMAPPQAGRAGYSVRVLPLKYVTATDVKSVLDPFVPVGGALQADAIRNSLIVSGPAADLAGFADLVRYFDVDWLSGKSFGIFPLHVGQAKDVAADVQTVLQQPGGTGGALNGLVRVVPIDRLNAVLVIAAQPGYLRQVQEWIERLDYGDDETTPRVFEYRVQNSRAVDLARVLTQLLSSGQVRTVGATTNAGPANGRNGSASGTSPLASSQGGLNSSFNTPASSNTTTGTAPTPATTTSTTGPGSLLGQQNRAAATSPDSASQALGDAGATEKNDLQLPAVRVVADEKNNALVIYAKPRDYRMLESVIRRLDVVPLQVLIEATIAEVTLNDNLQYGLQFYLKDAASRAELTTATIGTLTAADIAGVFPGFNYVINSSTQHAVLNLLRSVSNVRVVSSPQLLVLDHQTAALSVGAQVPIVTQSAQSVVTTDAPVVNSVDYRNTGVILQVTPRVNSSGLVTLDIDQEVSDVAPTTSSTINSPTINDRHIVSSVFVKDGQTVALGGLISENHSDSQNGIPVLDELPWVGPLFRDTNRSSGRTELIVLLSPKIIRTPSDASGMTEDMLSRMRTLKPISDTRGAAHH
ncbi:MAG TPA: type II secretion system secretin GspD [Stellaceae bacterium]|nr:type II secretion system secretin GspD [Stellaceae bacterium]